jgi:hypothetical protein
MKTLNNQIKRALAWTKQNLPNEEKDVLNITKIYGGGSASILEIAGFAETFHIEKTEERMHKIVIASQDLKKIVIILIKQKK